MSKYKSYTFTPPEGEPFSAAMPSMESFRDFLAEYNLTISSFGFDLVGKHESYLPPKGKRHIGTMVIHLNCQIFEDEPIEHDWIPQPRNKGAYSDYFSSVCANCGATVVKRVAEDQYGLPAATIDLAYYARSDGSAIADVLVDQLPPCKKPE